MRKKDCMFCVNLMEYHNGELMCAELQKAIKSIKQCPEDKK